MVIVIRLASGLGLKNTVRLYSFLSAWLYQKIKDFSEIDKALVLLYLEDKRYDEIAETLGISAGNARVKMNRIKERLKKMLG